MKPSEFLVKTLNEKLEKLRLNPEQNSAEIESVKSQITSAESASVAGSNVTENLSRNQEEMAGLVQDALDRKTIEITRGENGSSIRSIGSFEEVKRITEKLNDIYVNLEQMGLDVRVVAIGSEEKSASFFAIRFPEGYEGNRDPMKISPEEISEILKCQEKEKNSGKVLQDDPKNFWIEAIGSTDLVNDQSIGLKALGLNVVSQEVPSGSLQKVGDVTKFDGKDLGASVGRE